jgi:hypothetical protein
VVLTNGAIRLEGACLAVDTVLAFRARRGALIPIFLLPPLLLAFPFCFSAGSPARPKHLTEDKTSE